MGGAVLLRRCEGVSLFALEEGEQAHTGDGFVAFGIGIVVNGLEHFVVRDAEFDGVFHGRLYHAGRARRKINRLHLAVSVDIPRDI